MGQVFEHGLDFALADASDEVLEGLVPGALGDKVLGQAGDDFGDVLGGHGTGGQAKGTGVFPPLAAQDDLKVRHGDAVDLAAVAVEADVGRVVLAAGVEAAADLDPQGLDGLVELAVFLTETMAQFSG